MGVCFLLNVNVFRVRESNRIQRKMRVLVMLSKNLPADSIHILYIRLNGLTQLHAWCTKGTISVI